MPDHDQSIFRAIADPTRRDILLMLRGQDMTIAQVAQHFDMTRAAVKKHLTVLSDGGLIHVQQSGRERINSLNPGATRTAMRKVAYPGEDPLALRTPEEIMPTYLWLMGPDSQGHNGEAFDAQPPKQG